jgi:hypothetical protein
VIREYFHHAAAYARLCGKSIANAIFYHHNKYTNTAIALFVAPPARIVIVKITH